MVTSPKAIAGGGGRAPATQGLPAAWPKTRENAGVEWDFFCSALQLLFSGSCSEKMPQGSYGLRNPAHPPVAQSRVGENYGGCKNYENYENYNCNLYLSLVDAVPGERGASHSSSLPALSLWWGCGDERSTNSACLAPHSSVWSCGQRDSALERHVVAGVPPVIHQL